MHLVRATPLKLGVQASLSTAGHFTAATPIALDDSPICLRIKLVGSAPYRTSETISAHVHIFGPLESKLNLSRSPLDISNISIRIYYESRTTAWEIRPVDRADRQLEAPIIERTKRVQRQEVHRGIVPSPITTSWPTQSDKPFTVAFQDTLLGRPHAALPFSFFIPHRMDITESTNHNGLCSFMRCPPPSFRDGDTSVEWIIEATMELGSGICPTKVVFVSRLVFTVVPSVLDVGALRDEPFFGDDVGADVAGARVRQSLPDSAEAIWDCYTRTFKTHGCSIESELYVPVGAMVPRNTPTFPMHLSFRLLNTSSQPLLGLFRKNRPMIIRRAQFALRKYVSIRGGPDSKVQTMSEQVRQRQISLGDADPANSVLFRDATGGNESTDLVLLPFDLQTDGTHSKHVQWPMAPLKTLVPSFRTPNVQLEYTLTVSIFFVGDTREYRIARFPLQITPEMIIPDDKVHSVSDSKLSL